MNEADAPPLPPDVTGLKVQALLNTVMNFVGSVK